MPPSCWPRVLALLAVSSYFVGARSHTYITVSPLASDYEDVAMFIVFPASSRQECVTFNIVDDNIVEDVESFTVTGSGVSFVGGQNSTQVFIVDDDSKEGSMLIAKCSY